MKFVEVITDQNRISSENREILLKQFPKGVIAFDLEMTGLTPSMDKIIEISAIKLTPESVETFSTLVNPKKEISEASTAIHGITNEMVSNAPGINEAITEFLAFIKKTPLIAHNIKFDLGFLLFAMIGNSFEIQNSKTYCSFLLSKKSFPDFEGHSLGFLVKELNITLENHHRALDDAIATINLFALCLKKSDKKIKQHLEYAFFAMLEKYDPRKDFAIPEKLEGIKQRILKNHLVFIKYRGGSHKNEFRPIRPVSFLPIPGGTVLYSHCLLDDKYKSFSVRKITDWKEMNAEEIAFWNNQI